MISLEQKEIIKAISKKYQPKMIGVFGSYARNQNQKESDLDILVDFESNIDLLELIGLEQELSEVLGIKVDLVTLRSLNKKLKPSVEKDLIRIL
jgi:uncharacterized protein